MEEARRANNRLDPNRVEEAPAKAPDDFTDFASAVRRWLEGRTGPG